MKKIVSMVVVLTVLLTVFSSICVADDRQVVNDGVNKLKRTGLLMKVEGPKFYVHPFIWSELTLDNKEKVLVIFAIHYELNDGDGLLRCEVYNGYSGKRLAKYEPSGSTFY